MKKMKIVMDIETLGRMNETPLPAITCACIMDMESGREISLRLYNVTAEELEINRTTLLDTLDLAECIIGFNIILFDLEYIQKWFVDQVSESRLNHWIQKSIDPFLFMKSVFKETCSLDHLLTINKKSQKSGSGSNAIVLANNGKWDELLDYCMTDVKLTASLFVNDLGGFYLSDSIFVEWNLKKISKFPKVAYLCMEETHNNIPREGLSYEEVDFNLKSHGDASYEY